MTEHVPGTEGYVEQAAMLVPHWQRLSFTDKPKEVFELIPTSPSYVVDIGAGIGVDAAGLAAMGHRVVAIEPVDGLRNPGQAAHASSTIEWVADALPHLRHVRSRADAFALAMLSAVWMHLDEPERRLAMPNVASLLRPGGRMIMSLRHGPVPEGRRMFEVTADETIALADPEGLRVILRLEAQSVQQSNRSSGVSWTHLAFDKRVRG
jgi:SAM-dependent methyltransferase